MEIKNKILRILVSTNVRLDGRKHPTLNAMNHMAKVLLTDNRIRTIRRLIVSGMKSLRTFNVMKNPLIDKAMNHLIANVTKNHLILNETKNPPIADAPKNPPTINATIPTKIPPFKNLSRT